jgi:pimeloyl-ACP methyl ester carboxylesterase
MQVPNRQGEFYSIGSKPSVGVPEDMIIYGNASVGGVRIAYRECGVPDAPAVVLLHGTPSSSLQFRELMQALSTRFHLIAPDFPGCGNSEMPDPEEFKYSFETVSAVVEEFLRLKGFDEYGLYMHGLAGAAGFRLFERDPKAVKWLIIQNANIYEVGIAPMWDAVRAMWADRNEETEKGLNRFFDLDGIRSLYLQGAQREDLVSPDYWNSVYGFLQKPNARRAQLDLLYDYRSHVDLYPKWQRLLRERQPKTLIFWGEDDCFFTRAGGDAYRSDLPDAELYHLNFGHFALGFCGEYISYNMRRFYNGRVAPRVDPSSYLPRK